MKYRFFFIFFLLVSCSSQFTTINQKKPYTAKGFAIIYNDQDFNSKIIKGKMNNEILQISHQNLKTGTLINISNPKNNQSIVLKNVKRIKYPEFYKILITKKVAEKLSLDKKLPILEIIEIKKNKSFVAEKAKIFNEEKKISSNAPVTSVQISNISKNKNTKKNKKENEIYIIIASFYSEEVAQFLKKRITKEIPEYDVKKLKIKKQSNKEINLISGPYNTMNLMKNDYINLKKFGFEDLDISIYD